MTKPQPATSNPLAQFLSNELISEKVSGLDPVLEAKLWRNPSWFSFRLNYLALRYNTPIYEWAQNKYGLSRPECLVIYTLALIDGTRACDIVRTSGFSKNTLSLAIAQLEKRELIWRSWAPGQGRAHKLHLSKAGRELFEHIFPVFLKHERTLLSALNEEEQATLSQLLAKMVLSSGHWPERIDDEQNDAE